MAHARTTTRRPLHDRLLVKRVEEGEAKRGSILIPDSKRGDRALVGKYSGSEVKLDGAELLIMKEEDVLGILGGSGKDGHRA